MIDSPLHASGSMSTAFEVFNSLCHHEGIKLTEKPLAIGGFYLEFMGRRGITINSALNGISWLHVAYHELGHHFLHAPEPVNLSLPHDPHRENEADAFAKGALISLLHLAQIKGGGL